MSDGDSVRVLKHIFYFFIIFTFTKCWLICNHFVGNMMHSGSFGGNLYRWLIKARKFTHAGLVGNLAQKVFFSIASRLRIKKYYIHI